jgi:hypothetical protein
VASELQIAKQIEIARGFIPTPFRKAAAAELT